MLWRATFNLYKYIRHFVHEVQVNWLFHLMQRIPASFQSVWAGLSVPVLNWFNSYLSSRAFSVSVHDCWNNLVKQKRVIICCILTNKSQCFCSFMTHVPCPLISALKCVAASPVWCHFNSRWFHSWSWKWHFDKTMPAWRKLFSFSFRFITLSSSAGEVHFLSWRWIRRYASLVDVLFSLHPLMTIMWCGWKRLKKLVYTPTKMKPMYWSV